MRLLPNVPTDSLSATEKTWMNGETECGRHLSANRNPNGSQNISRYWSCVVDLLKSSSIRLLHGEISCRHNLMHKTVECLQGVWLVCLVEMLQQINKAYVCACVCWHVHCISLHRWHSASEPLSCCSFDLLLSFYSSLLWLPLTLTSGDCPPGCRAEKRCVELAVRGRWVAVGRGRRVTCQQEGLKGL